MVDARRLLEASDACDAIGIKAKIIKQHGQIHLRQVAYYSGLVKDSYLK